LSQFAGGEPQAIAIATERLGELPPARAPSGPDLAINPVAVEQTAVIGQAQAQLRALERSYFPRFALRASAYARGTGTETDGRILGGLNGLAPNVQNYAVGFTVTFPVLEFKSIQAREAVQAATIRGQEARYQQITTELRAQWNRAVAALDGARGIAANTPTQVSAARTVVRQATARYESGLGNIDEVAEAERLLTQAEIDDGLARLGVWRGLLGIATAAGDLQPFIAEVSQ